MRGIFYGGVHVSMSLSEGSSYSSQSSLFLISLVRHSPPLSSNLPVEKIQYSSRIFFNNIYPLQFVLNSNFAP